MMHFNVLLTMDPVQNICWQNNLSELKRNNIKHSLGLKKGKTRRVEISANNFSSLLLSLIHCWISTSCSQNSPSARVRKWEQTLMLSPDRGQMGKEWPEAAVLLLAWHKGSPGMMEIAKNSGVRAWPQGYHSLCPQPQTELGTRTGMKHPKQAEKDWLVRKRLAEEMWKVMVLCISVVCTGRLEGNICWLPLGEDNQENQTGYYNTGPQLKSK